MGHQGWEEGSKTVVFWGGPELRGGCSTHGEQSGGLGFPGTRVRGLPLTGTHPSGDLHVAAELLGIQLMLNYLCKQQFTGEC